MKINSFFDIVASRGYVMSPSADYFTHLGIVGIGFDG